jgi:AcrR family transcriptional regulator
MAGCERREQLLDIALRLFSRNGFDGTTVRDIAAEANVTDGLIYRYFASKDELLQEAITRARRVMHAVYCEVDGSEDVVAAVTRVFISLTTGMRANMAFIDLLWNETTRGGSATWAGEVLRGEMGAPAAALIDAYAAQGVLNVTDKALAVRILMGLAFSCACANRIASDAEWQADLAAYAPFMARVFVDGTLDRAG